MTYTTAKKQGIDELPRTSLLVAVNIELAQKLLGTFHLHSSILHV